MSTDFPDDSENLFRSIHPVHYQGGRVTSAAFKDPNGVSVDRQSQRAEELCSKFLMERFPSHIGVVKISVGNLATCEVAPIAKPDPENQYHCLLGKIPDKSLTWPLAISRKISTTVRFCFLKNPK